MEEEGGGLLGGDAKRPVAVRTDPIADTYAVEPRPFARGKFATVRRCRHLGSGAEYAAKWMRKRRRAADARHEILHEARVLRLADTHPRIVRMHEVYETPSEIVLVLELMQGGELQRVLDDQEVVAEEEAIRLLRQIVEGVAFLHRHRIAHLDLKPQNLLLTLPFPEGEVKLCDFGISRLITQGVEIREIIGTPDYVAPEVLHYEPISLATDMWSVGVLSYVLLSGHSPFGGESKQETFCNITRGALDFPDDLFCATSPAALDFMRRLLVRDPRGRMTAEECLSHRWLSQVGELLLPLAGVELALRQRGTSPSPPARRKHCDAPLQEDSSRGEPRPLKKINQEDTPQHLANHRSCCDSVVQFKASAGGVAQLTKLQERGCEEPPCETGKVDQPRRAVVSKESPLHTNADCSVPLNLDTLMHRGFRDTAQTDTENSLNGAYPLQKNKDRPHGGSPKAPSLSTSPLSPLFLQEGHRGSELRPLPTQVSVFCQRHSYLRTERVIGKAPTKEEEPPALQLCTMSKHIHFSEVDLVY